MTERTNRVSRRALIGGTAGAVALLTVPLISPATAGAAEATSPQDDLRADLDAVVATGAVSALAETRANGCRHRAAAGTIAIGGTEPAPAMAHFRAGSVIKPFVSVTVQQLADEGRLRLSDTIERWLPGVVPNGSSISLELLLRHMSGLPEYFDAVLPDIATFLRLRFTTFTARQLVDAAMALPPDFPPGTRHSYCNTNYLLLGMVIERATGNTYAHEIERRILRPLRLWDTILPGTTPTVPGPHAELYVPGEDMRPVDVTEMNPSLAGASGELISSTWDLNTFMKALVQGRLVDTRDMFDTLGTGYGLGIEIEETPFGRMIGHGGGGPGFMGAVFSTENGSRQATAFSSRWIANPHDALYALIGRALGGTALKGSTLR